jgi:dihydroxy-acid dehydratase
MTTNHLTRMNKQGHIQILYGNLAPEGSVAKITGKEGLHFEGKVRTMNSVCSRLVGL